MHLKNLLTAASGWPSICLARLPRVVSLRTSTEHSELASRDRLMWVGTPSTTLDMTRPLPLGVYAKPSVSRTGMQRALNRARLPFRSACVCHAVNGLIAAVAAGIGISAMVASLVPSQLTRLGPGHRLPELGTIDLVLLTNPRTEGEPAVRALISRVPPTQDKALGSKLVSSDQARANPTCGSPGSAEARLAGAS